MKKIVSILAVLVTIATFCFAKTFDDNGKIIDKFLQNGTYVKIVFDANNISYVSKECISSVVTDEDDLKLFSSGPILGNKSSLDGSFNVKKWNIVLDENNNLILTKK